MTVTPFAQRSLISSSSVLMKHNLSALFEESRSVYSLRASPITASISSYASRVFLNGNTSHYPDSPPENELKSILAPYKCCGVKGHSKQCTEHTNATSISIENESTHVSFLDNESGTLEAASATTQPVALQDREAQNVDIQIQGNGGLVTSFCSHSGMPIQNTIVRPTLPTWLNFKHPKHQTAQTCKKHCHKHPCKRKDSPESSSGGKKHH